MTGASRSVAVLRHPIVVGIVLAIISGVFASVLIPSLTRVWQDRPRELALKRDLVARIAREATSASDGASVGLGVTRKRHDAFFERLLVRWRTESSIIGAELTTYFPTSRIRRAWTDYMGAMNVFLHRVRDDDERALVGDDLVSTHFKRTRFDDAEAEHRRKGFVDGGSVAGGEAVVVAAILFLDERDQLASDVLASEVAGFSQGVWIFG